MKVLGLFTTGSKELDISINLLLLLLLAGGVAVLIWYIMELSKPKKIFNRREIPTFEDTVVAYNEKIDSAAAVLNEAGLDGNSIISSLGLRKTTCMLPQQENGECGPGFVKSGDCCKLIEKEVKSKKYQQELEFMAELAKGYIAGEIAEGVSKYIINTTGQKFFEIAIRQEGSEWLLEEGTEKGMKRLMKKGQSEAFEFVVEESIEEIMKRVTTKAAQELLEKALKKFVGEVIEKILGRIIATVMVKMAAWMARFMMFMSMGPAGWIISAIDALSTILDFMDFSGFNLYSSNQVNLKIRDVCEYNFSMLMQDKDMHYPALLELSYVYPDEYELVKDLVEVEFFGDAFNQAINDPAAEDEVTDMILSSIGIETEREDFPLLNKYLEKVMGEKHFEVNLMIHDLMQDTLSKMEEPPKYKITIYPEFSAPYRNAVSLTKESAQQWNEDHYEEWFAFLSGEKEYDVENGEGPPLSVVFTKNYGVPNPNNPDQDSNNPDMIQKSLSSPVPLAGIHYIVMKECLDKRAPMRMPREARRSGNGIMSDIASGFMELQYTGSSSLTPSKYGVTFNNDTRTCKFTPEYCRHVGLRYNAKGASGTSDCRLWEGQYEAELIFGTSLTRGAIKFGNNPEKEMKDFFQETVINAWQDPTRWARQPKDIAIRTGDMIKNASEGIAQRSKNFASAFGKNPAKAVVDNGIEVTQKGIEVATLVNPATYAHKGCESVGGAGGTACTTAVIAVFPPASILWGVSTIDKKLGITKDLGKVLGVGSNNRYNPIFFQVDSEGKELDSHEQKDINNRKTIRRNAAAMYFKNLKKGNDRYYARIYDRRNNIIVDNLFPDENTQIIDLTAYNDGSYKIMLKH